MAVPGCAPAQGALRPLQSLALVCLFVQLGEPPKDEGDPLGKQKNLYAAQERCIHWLQFTVWVVYVCHLSHSQGACEVGLLTGIPWGLNTESRKAK